MTKILLPVAALAVCLSSGCAFSTYDAPVYYQHYGTLPVAKGDNLPQISIGRIHDIRVLDNHRMIMNQHNGYGQTTTGGWQAEKDLTLIIKDALTQGISKSKLSLPRDRKILLEGQLIDVTSSTMMGWSKGTLKMRVLVKLSARDITSNEIIWRDTLYGEGQADGGSLTMKPTVLTAFRSALDNMVKNLFADEYFQQQVLN